MLGKLVWLITALAAINVGLTELGFGLRSLTLMQGIPAGVSTALAYLVGIAGLLSLIMMFTSWGNCCSDTSCSGCNDGSCNCKGPCNCDKKQKACGCKGPCHCNIKKP